MRTFDEKTQIKYGGFLSYVLVTLNILLGLVYTPWILKEIGDSYYGLYTLASTLTAMFLMDFGMSAAVTRFLSKYRAEQKMDSINNFVGLAVKLYFILMILLTIVFTVLYFNVGRIYTKLTPDEVSVFRIVFLIVALFLVICFPVNVCNGILSAYGEFVGLKGADLFNKIGTVLITILILLLHGDVYGLVFVNGLFNAITFIIKIILVVKLTPVKIQLTKSTISSYKELLSFSFWVTVQSVFQQFIFNIVPSILAMVMNTAAITLYGFANVIEGYVYNISSAINGMFMPKISRLIVDEDDASKTIELMIKVGRITLSITALLIIGLIALGREFVSVWVGDRYSDLYYCIVLLALPYMVSATQIIAENSLVALNKVKFSAMIKILVGVGNIIGIYCVAPKYGVIGVCAVTGGAFLVNVLLSNIVYTYILKINIFRFFYRCHIKMLLGISVSSALAYVVTQLFGESNGYGRLLSWISLGIKAVVIAVIYFLMMWFFAWNDDEKKLIRSIYMKKAD